VDGDGLSDVLVGAHGNASRHEGGSYAGRAYVILGSSISAGSSGSLSDAHTAWSGEADDDHAGWAVATGGDVDGDGLSEVLVGAYDNDETATSAGKAYLVSSVSDGPQSLEDADRSWLGESADDLAGWSVASAGDADGDGLGDVLITAPGNDDAGDGAGKVYLVLAAEMTHSTASLSDGGLAWTGEAEGDGAGDSVASAGDVDGDGRADILVGAYGNDDGGDTAGKAYLLMGARLAEGTAPLSEADHQLIGEAAEDYAGRSVASGGDVNGDGLSDILVGADRSDDGADNAGKAVIWLGR
jgi:hypothetical protein